MQPDIDVRLGDHRFNFRVAAVILRDGCVLMCSLPGSGWCFLPGGRVRAGEPTRPALERELHEELGIRVTAGPLAMVVENFFPDAVGRFHELGLYYLVDLPRDVDPTTLTDAENGATFRWVELDALPSTDLRPRFLCDALRRDLSSTEHFVNVE